MIYIASDHGGFELKNRLAQHLKETGQEVEDCGAHKLDLEDDYPDFVYPCGVKVGQNPGSMGIVIGRSGQGEVIVANKAKGVRAVLYYGGDENIVKLARKKNNANVLSLSGDGLTSEQAERAVDLFIETGFDGGRHQRRIEKISALEK